MSDTIHSNPPREHSSGAAPSISELTGDVSEILQRFANVRTGVERNSQDLVASDQSAIADHEKEIQYLTLKVQEAQTAVDGLVNQCLDGLASVDRQRQVPGQLVLSDMFRPGRRAIIVIKKQRLLLAPTEKRKEQLIQERLNNILPWFPTRSCGVVPVKDLSGHWRTVAFVTGPQGYPMYELESGSYASRLDAYNSLFSRLGDHGIREAVAGVDLATSSSPAARAGGVAPLLVHEQVSRPLGAEISGVSHARYASAITDQEWEIFRRV